VNSYTWKPTPSDTGMHVLQVWARRIGSTADYDGWTGTGYFTITP
jgi:hypothetical protein